MTQKQVSKFLLALTAVAGVITFSWAAFHLATRPEPYTSFLTFEETLEQRRRGIEECGSTSTTRDELERCAEVNDLVIDFARGAEEAIAADVENQREMPGGVFLMGLTFAVLAVVYGAWRFAVRQPAEPTVLGS